MKSALRWSMAGLAGVLLSLPTQAAERSVVTFGVLRQAKPEAARAQVTDWLKTIGKADLNLDAIWADEDRPLLDKVSESLAQGNAEMAKLLADASNPELAAPKEVPALLKDTKLPAFVRANLVLAYAKALSNRRVFEESLEALKTIKPEQVVEPATFFFHKAVAEHGMLLKTEATGTIGRLLDDVADAPDRYKMVATLMFFDMQQWKNRDLGEIARMMNNIERRLDLARGGPKTQEQQRQVVYRLDELIKKLEQQQQQQQQQAQGGGGQPGGNGGQCPEGGQPGNQPSAGQPNKPQDDSRGGINSGPGNVDPKKLKELVDAWGKLPERERAKAMTEMVRDLPPAYRQMVEDYFRKLAQAEGSGR